MRILPALIALWTFASGAAAVEAPARLGITKGVIIAGIGEQMPLELNEGTWTSCDTVRRTDRGVQARCEIAGGYFITPQNDGPWQKVPLTRLVYARWDLPGAGTVHEYIFRGQWEAEIDGVKMSTPVVLTLRYNDRTPANVRGTVLLENYDLTQGVQAARL